MVRAGRAEIKHLPGMATHGSEYLTERAKAGGVPLSELVNQRLKKDIELIEAGR